MLTNVALVTVSPVPAGGPSHPIPILKILFVSEFLIGLSHVHFLIRSMRDLY